MYRKRKQNYRDRGRAETDMQTVAKKYAASKRHQQNKRLLLLLF